MNTPEQNKLYCWWIKTTVYRDDQAYESGPFIDYHATEATARKMLEDRGDVLSVYVYWKEPTG